MRALVEMIVRSRRADLSSGKADVVHADFLSGLLQDPTYDDPIVLRDALVAMLFAGRENTQNTLAWALHALMGAPEWIQRLREEVAIMPKRSTEMEYSDLAVSNVSAPCYAASLELYA